MSEQVQALKKQTKMPRTGGRGANNKDEPRDKGIRIRTALYKKLVKLGNVENDVDDIVTMIYDFYEKHHHTNKEK